MNLINGEKALSLLQHGQIIAIPTETVYGLAAPIDNKTAIKSIFDLKKRPLFDPLIVHVANTQMISPLVTRFGSLAQKFAHKYWPGPMTMIMEKSAAVNPLLTANLSKVGIRIPQQKLTLKLIQELQIPLAAPSANTFKKVSPTKPEHVAYYFGQNFPILDGGTCEVGIESTVLELNEQEHKCLIYRQGYLTKNQIQQDFPELEIIITESPVAPGQLNDHYMPEKKLFLFPSRDSMKNYLEQNKINPNQTAELILPDEQIELMRTFYQKLHSMREASETYFYFILDRYKGNQESEIFQAVLDKLKKASSLDLLQ